MIAQTPNIINKRILQIAVPSIISNITVPLLGLIDVTIVGHLGAAAYIGAIAVRLRSHSTGSHSQKSEDPVDDIEQHSAHGNDFASVRQA